MEVACAEDTHVEDIVTDPEEEHTAVEEVTECLVQK